MAASSDDIFRGETVSHARPVAIATISYDHPTGLYAGLSGTIVATTRSGLQPLSFVAYTGYAHRLKSGLVLDAGVTIRDYSHFYSGDYSRHLFEAHVGIMWRTASARVYVSPDYDGQGNEAAYLETSTVIFRRNSWSVNGHVGLLLSQEGPQPFALGRNLTPDGRIGISKQAGRAALDLSWAVGGARSRGGLDRHGVQFTVSYPF